MTAIETKVYDYDKDRVREAIVGAFRKRKGEAAPADIVAFTGLPKAQVDAELPAVADEYSGRLKVTESGEILYSFPQGFSSRYRGFGPAMARFWKGFRKAAAVVGKAVFKAWIMLMLVGYFVLFIALVVLALVASVAASAGDKNGKSRSRGGGFALTGRLVDLFVRIWFYNEVFKSPGQRRYEADARARKAENRRPLHKAVFSFVFGEPDPNAGHDAVEKRAFVALARARKGVVLLEDFMAITGLAPAEAEAAVNRYLYEFEGSPEVSDDGTVYYRFPALLRRTRGDEAGATDSPFRRLRPFSANAAKSNAAYAAINGVNLAFGAYFLGCTFLATEVTGFTYLYWFTAYVLTEVVGLASFYLPLAIGLGAVPLAFSLLFWLVPAVRAGRLKRENERIKLENLRRVVYSGALSSPGLVRAPEPESLPAVARPADGKAAARVVEELAAYEDAEALADGMAWRLKELERKAADAERVRASVRAEDYSVGGAVFDTES